MSGFFFIALPYVAVVLAIGVGAYRFHKHPYSASSMSSQLLENRKLFWGSVPWHYGIGLILLAHVLAALFPGAAAMLLSGPLRLVIIESTGVALSLLALTGILILIARRVGYASVTHYVTSRMDGLILALLLLQVLTGIGVALFNRWGGLWYVRTAVPWLWSLAKLQPDVSTVENLPLFVQLHFVGGFVLILVFPFSRLVHMIKFPVHYLWRPYQRVIWYRTADRPRSHRGSNE